MIISLIALVEIGIFLYFLDKRIVEFIKAYREKAAPTYVSAKEERGFISQAVKEPEPKIQSSTINEDPALLLPAISKASTVRGFGSPNK